MPLAPPVTIATFPAKPLPIMTNLSAFQAIEGPQTDPHVCRSEANRVCAPVMLIVPRHRPAVKVTGTVAGPRD